MAGKAVWCLDVGANCIKALRAQRSGNRIEVSIFDVIEYDRPLDAPEVDPYEQMEKALITFLRRNDAERERVYVSMSGQSALFRFIPLPPVSKSKVPEIVQYEARQQIPFPLDEVVWGYDTIDRGAKDAEQIEVGLFAMKKELIFQFLAPFRTLGFEIDAIQLVPNALYNFLAFEKPMGPEATIILDVGAKCTNLLVVSEDVVWQRILQIAGSEFTRTIEETFDIPWSKAEKLKRRVKKHKHADKIYKSIRPTLDRLVDEVQRSMGFFKSTHKGVRIENILAMGGCFKLPGMVKFLEDHLNYDVKTVSSLQNFDIERALNPQLFRDNIMSFGVCLGLAVQALFPERAIDVSLLPQQFLMNKMIQRKRPYAAGIAAAAGVMVLASGLHAMARAYQLDDEGFKQGTVAEARELYQKRETLQRDFQNKWSEIEPARQRQKNLIKPFEVRGTGFYKGTVSPTGVLYDDGITRNLVEIAAADGRVRELQIREQNWQVFCRELEAVASQAPAFKQALQALPEKPEGAEQEPVKAWAWVQAGTKGNLKPEDGKKLLDGLNQALARPNVLDPVAKPMTTGQDKDAVIAASLEKLAENPELFRADDIRRVNRRILDRAMGQSLMPMRQRVQLFDIQTRRVDRAAWLWKLDQQMLENPGGMYGLAEKSQGVFFKDKFKQYRASLAAGRQGNNRRTGPDGGAKLDQVASIEFDPGYLDTRPPAGVLQPVDPSKENVPDPMMGPDPDLGWNPDATPFDPGFGGGGPPAEADQQKPGKEILEALEMPDSPVVRVTVRGSFDATEYANKRTELTKALFEPINRRWYPIFNDPEFGIDNLKTGLQDQVIEDPTTLYVDKARGLWVLPEEARKRAEAEARKQFENRTGVTVTDEMLQPVIQRKMNELFERREVIFFQFSFYVDPTRDVVRVLEKVKAEAKAAEAAGTDRNAPF